jgi:hypothetical protein
MSELLEHLCDLTRAYWAKKTYVVSWLHIQNLIIDVTISLRFCCVLACDWLFDND